MNGKWMCFVVFDFIIFTQSSPGRFYHDFYKDTRPQWSQGWSNGWGHGWGQEWHHTTQRAWTTTTTSTTTTSIESPATTTTSTTTTTTESPATTTSSSSSPNATPPQPIISDFEIRLGDTNATTPNTLSSQAPTKQLQVFAPGPVDDSDIPDPTEDYPEVEAVERTTEFIPSDPIEDDGHLDEWLGVGGVRVPKLPGTSAPIYQWHVGIYSKTWVPYKQICGGSLVKQDFVISAAHCFWDDAGQQQPASQFAVAGGKVYRPWNITQDTSAQQSDVAKIILPIRFRGATTSFQDDIAILRLRTPFTYAPGVQPVCVNFHDDFMREQLQPGIEGTVCGWGLTTTNGLPSQVLTYLDIPYIELNDCFEQFAETDPSFLKYITSDKICVGFRDVAKALCRGDSGGGYVIFSEDTPFLHGVASTAASNEYLCNAFSLAALTSVYAHRTFIRDNIPDVENECARLGIVTTERNDITGNVLATDAGLTGNVAPANAGLTGNVAPVNSELTGNVAPANAGLTGNLAPTIVGLTGNEAAEIRALENDRQTEIVRPAAIATENGGTIGMAMGTAPQGITPAFLQPHYPYQFYCNCNCKP